MTLVDRVADLVRERAGLQLDAVMRTRLVRALADGRLSGEDDAAQLARLRRDPRARQALYDELTVQETSFFRDAGQFAGLADTVLPQLRDPVVLWSAGCSNGQEAWSLAMVLAEQGRRGQVVATDLSERALARTREGRYAERELRGLSAERRARWLVPDGDGFRIAPALRDRVVVHRHNLVDDAPPVPRASVVFCRNVLIYFSRDEVVATVARFRSVLPPDGWLFLGFSETLWTMSEEFVSVRLGEAYAYRPAGTPTPVRGPSVGRAQAGQVPVLGDLRDLPGPPAPAGRPTGPGAAVPAGPGAAAPPRPPVPAGVRAALDGEVGDLLAAGERALRAGLAADAVSAFRGAAYLAPDLPLAHLELGLALHALGERAAARRALQTAKRVLQAGGADVAGWDAATLGRWIDERLAAVEDDA